MYQLLLFCFLLSSYNLAYGQERVISGKVTSPVDGAPLPGVNVLIKGTSEGTITDIDGNYSISANDNDVLVFSFVGFSNSEVPVSSISGSNYSIILKEDIQALSEVVVIGYGTQEKRDATGAVASVKAEDFNRGVISSPEQLIQGKSAGVQIAGASGEPGAGVNIRIRGTTSVRANNGPLFVIDGVPLSSEDISPSGQDNGRGTSSARNPLNFLNPNDIQSIDILKDASATAIYGSRGANGVVLITTKSGKGRKHQVDYTANVSLSRLANKFDLLNREQYIAALESIGNTVDDAGSDTDWQDEISRTAVSHRHDIAYSNSHKTGNYRASVSYDKQQGVIKNSDLERITGRLNLNQTFLNDKLKFNGQLTLSRVNDEQAPITDAAGFEGDLLGSTYMQNPTRPADPDEQFGGDIANPLSMLKYIEDLTHTNRSLINLSLGYDILEDLNFTVSTGFDNSESTREDAISGSLQSFGIATGNGRANINTIDASSKLLEAVFSYDKSMDNSSVSAVLGYSYQEFNRSGMTVSGFGFANNNMSYDAMISDLDAASSSIQGLINESYQQFAYTEDNFFITKLFPEPVLVYLDGTPETTVRSLYANTFDLTDELQSFFGRINYTLYDKYLLTATLRADGSTKFGGDNKYGYFPSAAFAWRLSDEEFVPDFFYDLKLRAGYGITGNQELPHNRYQTRQRWTDLAFSGSDGTINEPSLRDVAFANPGLKWEQTSSWNLGLDFGVFNNRLSGSLDFYRKVTSDLLIQVRATQPSPQPFLFQNLDADVINTGVEVTLNIAAIATENLGLDFNLNYSYNDNIVENYNGILPTGNIRGQGLSGSFAQNIANGQPINAYVLREFDGYDEEGLEVSRYVQGDAQNYLGHSPLPKSNVGFSANLSYKNWDFSAFMYGMFGHYIYNNTAHAYFTKGALGSGRNVIQDVVNSPESKSNTPEVSTRFIEKGDFLRLQNLNLGYNFSFSDNFIRSLRLSVSAQNLFVITDYSGLDPEVTTNAARDEVPSVGIDYTAYPRARTFTFGLSASF